MARRKRTGPSESEPPPPAPKSPSEDGNLFEVAQHRVRYEEQLSKHGLDCDRREKISRRRIKSFLAELEPLLDPDQDAVRTDVWGAVRRAALFLQENDAAWGVTTENWAVFVSDGEDNVGSTPASFPSSVRTVVVNGSAETGALDQLNPLRFESPRAAFDFIAADKERAQ